MLDSARYFFALIVLVSMPPALLLWFIIHPFVRFWRRLGPGWTYTLLSLPVAGLMAGLFLARHRLLTTDFGTNYPLIALAALCILGGAAITVRRRRHLSYGTLAGIPELRPEGHTGKLLTEGIYASIRHPRYVETFLWILGYALFANYLTPYIITILSAPTGYLIVLLEERELHDRFGGEYEEYCRKVPRFFPRRNIDTKC